MLEYRSPKRIYLTLVSAGFLLGFAVAQLALVLIGKLEYSSSSIIFPALASVWGLVWGWRMVLGLPWAMINDPANYEYRNPYAPSKTAGDGGEKDSTSVPSPDPTATPPAP
jgi:hypothetical protein